MTEEKKPAIRYTYEWSVNFWWCGASAEDALFTNYIQMNSIVSSWVVKCLEICVDSKMATESQHWHWRERTNTQTKNDVADNELVCSVCSISQIYFRQLLIPNWRCFCVLNSILTCVIISWNYLIGHKWLSLLYYGTDK